MFPSFLQPGPVAKGRRKTRIFVLFCFSGVVTNGINVNGIEREMGRVMPLLAFFSYFLKWAIQNYSHHAIYRLHPHDLFYNWNLYLLIPKDHKRSTERTAPDTDTNVLKRVWMNQIQQYLIRIIHNDQLRGTQHLKISLLTY